MGKHTFSAYAKNADGNIVLVQRGDILISFQNEIWTYKGTHHPRKVYVERKEDEDGPNYWPNLQSMEFYASVFNLGIWDNDLYEWSFPPEWDNPGEMPPITQVLPIQTIEPISA